MSKSWAVFKREFGEATRTRMFIIGTLFGPILIIGFMFAPLLFMGSSFGQRDVVLLDASGTGLGGDIATALAVPLLTGDVEPRGNTYVTTVTEVASAEAAEQEREALRARIRDEADDLDGYVYLPPGILEDDDTPIVFETRSAGQILASEVRRAVQNTVQQRRLEMEGMEPIAVARAMRDVPFDARRVGRDSVGGTPESLMLLAIVLGYAIFIVVMLYGQSVMRGVLEEKRDRIVELIFSSMRARDLMFGKIVGIGGAGLLQMAVWTLFAAVAMTWGADYMRERGQTVIDIIPEVSWTVGLAFLIFFFGGFLLYAALYAAAGAIATTDQEAQQLVFPVILPLVIAFFMLLGGTENPDSAMFVAGSLVPLTSPVIMPVRMALAPPSWWEFGLSVALLILGIVAIAWVAAKIYRIGTLSTGKRPTARELLRWLRTA